MRIPKERTRPMLETYLERQTILRLDGTEPLSLAWWRAWHYLKGRCMAVKGGDNEDAYDLYDRVRARIYARQHYEGRPGKRRCYYASGE